MAQDRKLMIGDLSAQDGFLTDEERRIRGCLESQTCPFCGRTTTTKGRPFSSVASHINQRHGVSRIEIRRLAALSRAVSICSPELSAESQERFERDNRVVLENARTRPEPYFRRPDDLVGHRIASLRVQERMAGVPAEQRVLGAHVAGLAAAKVKRAASATRDAEILRLLGEDLLLRDIAGRVGMNPQSLSRRLRILGVPDGRSSRQARAAVSEAARQRRRSGEAADE